MKECTGCHVEKPEEEFPWNYGPRAKGTRATRCRDCVAKYKRDWNKKNPEKVKRANIRAHAIRSGIDPDKALDYIEAHDGLCEICGNPAGGNGSGQTLHLDHDHETSALRGLLCSYCNVGLGHFKDSPELLIKAAEYIRSRRK